jgi:branched-chain amino acid transport system substrate-binding protein
MSIFRSSLSLFICITSIHILIFSKTECYSQPQQQVTKIGISVSLTGDGAVIGADMKSAFEFANKMYGKDKYELIFEDDRCDAKTASSIAHKFSEIDKVQYVLGFTCSSAAAATVPIYEKAKVLMLATSASSPRLINVSPYFFRLCPNDLDAAKILGSYASKKFNHIGLIAEVTEYAQALGDEFEKGLIGAGKKVERENVLPNSTDFRPMIFRMINKGIDALFINTQAEKIFSVVLLQAKQSKPTIPILGAYWPGSNAVLELAHKELEGTVFVDTPSLDSILNAEGQSMLREFYNQGGRILGTEAMFATAFEGFRSLTQAIESGIDPREFLQKTTFHGVFGTYTFDEKRELQGLPLALKIIKDSKAVILN